jgi:hypothetical protein
MVRDDEESTSPGTDVDPKDFLRALLNISPEDAEKVREDTPGTRKRVEEQDGPSTEKAGPTASTR